MHFHCYLLINLALNQIGSSIIGKCASHLHKIRQLQGANKPLDPRQGAKPLDPTGGCGVVGSTLAFGSVGHGFESEHRLFSHHGASAFSKLRLLAKCSLDDSVRRLL